MATSRQGDSRCARCQRFVKVVLLRGGRELCLTCAAKIKERKPA